MQGASDARRSGSLARQLVTAAVGFCLLFTLLTAGLRIWFAWRDNLAAMRGELQQVSQVFKRTLAKAVWEMDREALKAHIDSAAQVPSVGRIELHIKRASGGAELVAYSQPGWAPSGGMPSLVSPLVYEPYAGATEVVGELRLEGDPRVLWPRLHGELATIVMTQVIQSVLLAGLIMWRFNRSVTIHVQHAARHIEQLSPESLQHRLKLQRGDGYNDELTLLEGGVNHLQGSLSDYLERHHQYERELAEHRDRLADLVRERTQELEAANTMLEEMSRRDPLTGLPNRRHFDDVKEAELRRARRSRQPLSVLLCDVDFFKRYNDTYGHAMGDHCLKAVAKTLLESFGRSGELPARIGGEEFAVLLPATDEAQAREQAERVRAAVVARAIPHAGSEVAPHVTLSIGIAQFDPDTMPNFDALLHCADQALYRAKRQGRNRVSI